MTDQALSDVKVVEWGTFISAPFCTKLMADMGAEVIKVEPPSTGDENRFSAITSPINQRMVA